MIFSLSNELKRHLYSIDESIHQGLGNQDNNYRNQVIYHYFCSPHDYYKQYDKCLYEVFQREIDEHSAQMIKIFQIGILASNYYLTLKTNDENTYLDEYNLYLLEESSLKDVVKHFYKDKSFAFSLISSFYSSSYLSYDELLENRKKLRDKNEEKVLINLNPLLIGEDLEYNMQKRKKL